MGVGAKIKTLLSERNMTIKELSEKTGISINTLYSITKRDSSNVRISTLEAIANALNVKPDVLITYEQFKKECDRDFARLQQSEKNLRKHLISLSNMLNIFGLSILIEELLELLKDPENCKNLSDNSEEIQETNNTFAQKAEAEATDPDQSTKK